MWSDAARWMLAVWVGAGLLALCAYSVYLAVNGELLATTPWTGRLLYRFGQAVIVAGVLVAGGLMLGLAISAGIRIGSP